MPFVSFSEFYFELHLFSTGSFFSSFVDLRVEPSWTSVEQQVETEHNTANIRSSYPEVFCRNSALKNFAKFTAVLESLFNKIAGLGSLLKERVQHRCFPVNFAKYSRTTIFTEHHWWPHLKYTDCIWFSYLARNSFDGKPKHFTNK